MGGLSAQPAGLDLSSAESGNERVIVTRTGVEVAAHLGARRDFTCSPERQMGAVGRIRPGKAGRGGKGSGDEALSVNAVLRPGIRPSKSPFTNNRLNSIWDANPSSE
ncbi:hypothetical protein SKAU_G00257890 [Synaphobranchus kaupii]|uniref:Uncharacterized protein n=1 Tax=Synaphobranchus kaupii TaxID=118154 RepID=A0A9Q1IQF9_SYNKA|nr:hypothetical protein SKAU_G00257890 [Synaphobranchus kaupii]